MIIGAERNINKHGYSICVALMELCRSIVYFGILVSVLRPAYVCEAICGSRRCRRQSCHSRRAVRFICRELCVVSQSVSQSSRSLCDGIAVVLAIVMSCITRQVDDASNNNTTSTSSHGVQHQCAINTYNIRSITQVP